MDRNRSSTRRNLSTTRLLLASVVVAGLVAVAGALQGRREEPTPSAAAGPPHFVDVTEASGIDHLYDGDFSYAVGGGVAAFDCDGDGKPDLYLAGGDNPAALYRNDTPSGGALRFSRIPDPVTDLTGVLGAYALDIDSDGHPDLVVLRKGESVILRGLGGCRFERSSLGGPSGYTTAFSASWESGSPLPTLAFGHYLKLDPAGGVDPAYECDGNELWRPDPDRTGYDRPLHLSPGYCSLSMLFSDWDRSGRRDLRVTNDRQYYIDGQDQLWRVAPGEPPRLYTDLDGWVSLQIWGMGIASFDLTGRGYPDVFLTSQGDNKLQTLAAGPAQPTYRDVALKRRVLAAQPFTGGDVRPSTAWHAEFQDVNNDGFVDLFVTKGNVSAMPDYAAMDPNNLLLGQPDGSFNESADTAGVLNFARGRGAVLADFAMDGLLDLIEVNYGQPVRVWRNLGSGTADEPSPMGNWLELRPHQDGPNPDAIGAWIEVQLGKTTVRRELTVGGGHAGGELGWSHFGLGSAQSAQVRVIWPDGQSGPWRSLSANQFAVIGRGQP